MVWPLNLLYTFDNPNCAGGPLLMYFSRIKDCQTFEIKCATSTFHCNLFSIYREHFEMSKLYLTESNNRKIGIEIPCVENFQKIYGRRRLSTRKTAIISREIRNLISHFLTHKFSNRHKVLPLYRMVFFGSAQDGRRHPPYNLSLISHNDETWRSYTLPKEDSKNIWITWHTPWVQLTSQFFHRKSVDFVISRNKDIDCILIHKF